MTKEQWLNYVIKNQRSLLSLVSLYHPTSNQRPALPITAPVVEANCAVVRKNIADNWLEVESAATLFQKAIQEKDTSTLSKLLSDTWFGVPESTSCWQVTGFKECVDLLDDPVEDEDYE